MPSPRNTLAKIFTGALHQFSTVRKYTERTVGLKMTGPTRTKFLPALLSIKQADFAFAIFQARKMTFSKFSKMEMFLSTQSDIMFL